MMFYDEDEGSLVSSLGNLPNMDDLTQGFQTFYSM